MGNGILRFANRNQARTPRGIAVPEKPDQGWVYHVPIFHIHKALPEPRKCRCTYKACKIIFARYRVRGCFYHYRQAIRDDGTVQQGQTGRQAQYAATIGTILIFFGKSFAL